MEDEVWKDITGFKGKYQVSNYGFVRSLNYHGTRNPHLLKQGHGDGRYPQVVLMKEGKRYTRRVHRLVAEAFIPNPEAKGYIDHIDADIENNFAGTVDENGEVSGGNLRWATARENANNPITARRRMEGIRRYWENRKRQSPSKDIHFCS